MWNNLVEYVVFFCGLCLSWPINLELYLLHLLSYSVWSGSFFTPFVWLILATVCDKVGRFSHGPFISVRTAGIMACPFSRRADSLPRQVSVVDHTMWGIEDDFTEIPDALTLTQLQEAIQLLTEPSVRRYSDFPPFVLLKIYQTLFQNKDVNTAITSLIRKYKGRWPGLSRLYVPNRRRAICILLIFSECFLILQNCAQASIAGKLLKWSKPWLPCGNSRNFAQNGWYRKDTNFNKITIIFPQYPTKL